MENEKVSQDIAKMLQYMVNSKLTLQETADFFNLEKEELLAIIETSKKELRKDYSSLLKQVEKIIEEENKIEAIARYIIENQATNQMAADEFDLSKSSVQKYINKKLVRISPTLYDELKETQKIVLNKSQILGGTIGKRGPSITDFEALEIAEMRIDSNATFEELAKKFNVPPSTIHEALKRLDYPEVQYKLEQTTAINLRLKGRNSQLKQDQETIYQAQRKK